MNGAERKENIFIKNARVNNLKNISVSIPINQFTCVTGVSGCGKSSLIYDTLYAESQRNFLESMSGNMFGQRLMDKPDVEEIENLKPALNVSQNYYNHNPRSTIGTLTDISHYLRTLFALIINYQNNKKYNGSFFSANNPGSCCKHCNGLGEEYVISEELLIPDTTKTLKSGAIKYYKGKETSLEYKLLVAICDYYNIDINKRVEELSAKELETILYREDYIEFDLTYKSPRGRYKKKNISERGAVVELQEKLKNINTPSTFASISKYLVKDECSICNGTKFSEKVLEYRICKNNIADIENMPLLEVVAWLVGVKESVNKQSIYNQVSQLLHQIFARVEKMIELKLGYLSLDRSIPTLSGGEVQRVRIANQLNCSLTGLVYILDEPCKGLHYKNINSILGATKELVNKGNTVVAIEHNQHYISGADKIIELGVVGGPQGGYLISEEKVPTDYNDIICFKPQNRVFEYFELKNILFRNIKNQNVAIPISAITCVTGVSGSGKSTLVTTIYDCFSANKNVHCDMFTNYQGIKHVYRVNQQPIGRTPRSTVVSYLNIYDSIRDLFAETSKAKELHLSAADFSMNVVGSRCECCQGTGMKKIQLNYLPDSFIKCPECNGKRFKENLLKVQYKGYSMDEILESPIEKIMKIFDDKELILHKLRCVIDIGLGYLKLGQMSMNLSGGEAQRIKLAKALGNKSTGKNLYILDEPTSGLNTKDIEKFSKMIVELQKKGETIIIIEHNIEFISKIADYLVDFGLQAGDNGGVIVAQGKPQQVFKNKKSSWYDYREES